MVYFGQDWPKGQSRQSFGTLVEGGVGPDHRLGSGVTRRGRGLKTHIPLHVQGVEDQTDGIMKAKRQEDCGGRAFWKALS